MRLIDADVLLERLSSLPADQFFNMTSIRNTIKAEPTVIDISNLLCLMIMGGATREELLRVIGYSMIVIDTKKYVNDILELQKKYQGEEDEL